jgi:L,D-peptidoglycan transpeptidase YkuD (ErfK/YbiS/YcfS/YnhG family)
VKAEAGKTAAEGAKKCRMCTALVIAALVLTSAGDSHPVFADGNLLHAPEHVLMPVEKKLGGSSQVLIVVNDCPSSSSAVVHVMEKHDGRWRSVMPAMSAVIGKNGFAPEGEKREGDGRTPSGIYPLGLAFGYGRSAETRMPYRQATADDLWVDDPAADEYNRWVKEGETQAASFESMRREDDLYKYGIVIEYNTNPVIKGRGSAIFLHVWQAEGNPTGGCVAVSEKDLIAILRWLDPSAKPVVVMGTLEEGR